MTPMFSSNHPLDLPSPKACGVSPSKEVSVSTSASFQSDIVARSIEESFNVSPDLQSSAAVNDLLETLATQEESTMSEKPTAVVARITPVVEQTLSRFISITTCDINQQEAMQWDEQIQSITEGTVPSRKSTSKRPIPRPARPTNKVSS